MADRSIAEESFHLGVKDGRPVFDSVAGDNERSRAGTDQIVVTPPVPFEGVGVVFATVGFDGHTDMFREHRRPSEARFEGHHDVEPVYDPVVFVGERHLAEGPRVPELAQPLHGAGFKEAFRRRLPDAPLAVNASGQRYRRCAPSPMAGRWGAPIAQIALVSQFETVDNRNR